MLSSKEEQQQHTSEEYVFLKINELDVEEPTMIAKRLALTIADDIKSSRSSILKIIMRHLSSEEMDTSEGKAIFDNLGKCFIVKTEIPHENQRHGAALDNNELENSFQHFELERESSKIFKHKSENPQTWIRLKEFKINGKIGTSGQKDRLSSSSLIFQIQNGVKNGYSDSEIYDAIVKNIAPDLLLRTYLEGKADLNLVLLSKTLRSHFGEPNATTLFNELGNAKQMPTETAQEFVIRMISLRQKVLFVSNGDSLIQDRLLHDVLVGLRNDNIRHEIRPLLKSTIILDEDILENLGFATADELEHISKFKNKQINVHTIEASDDMSKLHRDKKQNQKAIEFDFHSLKSMLDDLTEWRIDVDQKNK